MVKQFLVDILIKKIRNQEINPKTGQPFNLDDILIQECKDAVSTALAE